MQETEQTRYQRWLRRTHGPAHARRTAERNAAFFLPHLQPGMRLIDAGSGPGSITIGLAAAIAPGEAVGVDASDDAVAQARTLAAERGVANARFMPGDVHALPFPDGTFDAAFSHALLQHLADPLAAVRELRRVLRPGGVIGLADADFDGALTYPSLPGVEASFRLMRRMRERTSSPYVGRCLRELLHDAGFVRVVASAEAGCVGDDARTAGTAEFEARYLEAPEFAAHVEAQALATRAELATMAADWRAWGAHRGAFQVRIWCQAVGWAG
jgi:ubiquinone/menaquinone biosynthesis C-methylase UbiE